MSITASPPASPLRCAAELARDLGADLRLVSMVHVPVAYAPGLALSYDWPVVADEDRKATKKMLADLAGELAVPATTTVVDGFAGEELERLSEQVDLLVLGSRGWGAFRRVMLGSTSDRIARHSACPVLVVPAPAEQPADTPAVPDHAASA